MEIIILFTTRKIILNRRCRL